MNLMSSSATRHLGQKPEKSDDESTHSVPIMQFFWEKDALWQQESAFRTGWQHHRVIFARR